MNGANVTLAANLPTHETMVQNIINTYNRATPAQKHAGEHWYDEALQYAKALAAGSIFSHIATAGVIAALSPQQSWSINQRQALTAIQTYPNIPSMHTKAQMAKVMRILAGESPLDVLQGPKETAFFRNCSGDWDTATIDRWAFLTATGTPVRDGSGGGVGKKAYKLVALAYNEAARILGIPVAILQAIVWVVERNSAV